MYKLPECEKQSGLQKDQGRKQKAKYKINLFLVERKIQLSHPTFRFGRHITSMRWTRKSFSLAHWTLIGDLVLDMQKAELFHQAFQ